MPYEKLCIEIEILVQKDLVWRLRCSALEVWLTAPLVGSMATFRTLNVIWMLFDDSGVPIYLYMSRARVTQ